MSDTFEYIQPQPIVDRHPLGKGMLATAARLLDYEIPDRVAGDAKLLWDNPGEEPEKLFRGRLTPGHYKNMLASITLALDRNEKEEERRAAQNNPLPAPLRSLPDYSTENVERHLASGGDWRILGACGYYDIAPFMSRQRRERAVAIRVCQQVCPAPVRDACREEALAEPIANTADEVRGGIDPLILQKMKRAKVKED